MPQAVSPRRPSGSAFPPPSPGQRNDRKPKAAPTLKARTNPRDWDPEKLARYYMRHGNPVTSPILAKIVLENKIDGHALCDIPEDVFSEILEDQQLAEDMRATAHDLRARAGTHLSPTSRIPRAQDIMASLASLSDAAPPSLSASPEPAEERERPPSPYTPPPWDWSDDEDAPYPGGGFGGAGAGPTLLHFGSPGTAPHLLQPLLSLSPGAPYELSALDVPDAARAADFAASDAHEAHSAHEDSAHESDGGDAGAGGHGDHPGLPAAHGGLPGRQDEGAGADDASSVDTWHDVAPATADVPPDAPPSAVPQTHAPQPTARPRLRLNPSLTSLPSRPGSCPPGLVLAPYIPPRAPSSEAKAYADEGVQAGADVPPAYASVAVQTRALADAQVQTDAAGAELLDAEPSLGGDAGETRERAEGPEDGAKEPEPTLAHAHGHDAPAGDAAETAQARPAAKGRRKRARARAKTQGEQEETDVQEPDGEQLETETAETEPAAVADTKASQKEEDLPPPPPPKSDAGLANGTGDVVQESAALQTPAKDPQPRALAALAQRTVGGRRDSSWGMGATPQPLPAAPATRSVSGSFGAGSDRSAGLSASADPTDLAANVSADTPATESPRAGKTTKKLFTAPRAERTHSSPGDIELRDTIAATVRSNLQGSRRVQSQDRASGARGRRGSSVGASQLGRVASTRSEKEGEKKREETLGEGEQEATGEGGMERQDEEAADERVDELGPSQDQQNGPGDKGDGEVETSGWEFDSELDGDLDAEASNVASTTQVASIVDGGDQRPKEEASEAPPATPKPPPQTVPVPNSPVSDPLLLKPSDILLPAEPPAQHVPAQRRTSTASTADSFVDASDALAADGEHNSAHNSEINGTGTHGALPGHGAETLTSGSEAESEAETAHEDPDVPQKTPLGEQDADPFDLIDVIEAGGAEKEPGREDAGSEVPSSGAVEHGGQDAGDGQAKGADGEENGQHAATTLSDALAGNEVGSQDADSIQHPARDTKANDASAEPSDTTGKTGEHMPSSATKAVPTDASINGTASEAKAAEKSPAENDLDADFAMVSLEEGRGAGQDDRRGAGDGEGLDAESAQSASAAKQARHDAEGWEDVAHPVAQPAPSKAVRPTVRVDAPQRAATTSPVEQRQMRRMPSDSRPSSTGGLNPFQPPGLRREASPGGVYSPAPKKAGSLFQSIVNVASDMINPSEPATPVTPGDDGDAEEAYFELDDATIANMNPEEREKYREEREKRRKKEKKKRQAQNKKKEKKPSGVEGVFGSWW